MDEEMLGPVFESFPIPPGARFSYGTAGFRLDASMLESTTFRVGILAALRSLDTKAVTGLMITASHNPEHENGIKVVDPDGGMLTVKWEPYADSLANAMDIHSFLQIVKNILEKENITCGKSYSGRVFLARDTRPSGKLLLSIAQKGIESVPGVVSIEMGVLSTPQLHWIVRATNKGHSATEKDYYYTISESFKQLIGTKCKISNICIVDGANGVGAHLMQKFQELIDILNIEIRNSGKVGEGKLNDHVGADFVQKERKLPYGFSRSQDAGKRCVSLDGDADRLVYFYIGTGNDSLQLLDGDKISSLLALFIQKQLKMLAGNTKQYGSDGDILVPEFGSVKIGVVQTAYANGASSYYLKKQLGLHVTVTSTGVKHLHHKAKEYDIGIYFEANGHGTVLFSEKFLSFLTEEAMTTERGNDYCEAIQCLLSISQIANQAIGDALSGVLLVEAILARLGWSIHDWSSIYTDLPSRQLKVNVKDRFAIKTTANETRVLEPIKLQTAIDKETNQYEHGRAFVRPSGTEDIIRVYAEAATQAAADALALAIVDHVHRQLAN